MVSFGLVGAIDWSHNKKSRLLLLASLISVYIILLFLNVIVYYHGVKWHKIFSSGFSAF